MKLLLSALLCLSFVYAADPAVLAAEKQWVDAVLHPNAAVLTKLMSPDLIYTHSSAQHQTREQFIESITSHNTTYTSITFSDEVVRQFGHTVIVSHNMTTNTVKNGEAHLYVTEVWVEQNGAWQMVSRQATKLTQ
jgi:hypothetical protein